MDRFKELREKALEIKQSNGKIDKEFLTKDFYELVEELSIYKIELEQQNQELLDSQLRLEYTRARYYDLFNNAPVGYLLIDEKFIIHEINNTAISMIDKAHSNYYTGKKITYWVHPEDQDTFHLTIKRCFEKNEKKECNIRFLQSSNQSIYYKVVSIKESDPLDETYLIRVTIIDINNEIQLEEKLKRETEKAKESDRLKSAFLANMSHEIRTPMNGIIGFSELLKKTNVTPQKQAYYADLLQKSGKRLLELINNLIDISKIEANQMNIYYTDFSLYEQLEFVYRFYKEEAQNKDISLRLIFDSENSEITIKSDREKLVAVLTNLVKNAIKYTKEGQIEIGHTQRGKQHHFYVKDSGIGISENTLSVVFNRFERDKNVHNSNIEGSGLGLSIAKSYVEMLGGEINAKSKLGEGSTFSFFIPDQSM